MVKLHQKSSDGSALVVAYKAHPEFDAILFRQLYDDHFDAVYGMALRFLKSESLAKDVVQEVFIKCWNHRETMDLSQNVQAYLLTITKNCLLNTIRKNKNEIIKVAAAQQAKTENELDTLYHTDWKLNWEAFQKSLESLSPRKRIIFTMKVLHGMSNEEIAGRLNLSINTVKFQYSDAKAIIESQIKK